MGEEELERFESWEKRTFPKNEKPLTSRELYVAKKCLRSVWRMESANSRPSQVRRLLKARHKHRTTARFIDLYRKMRLGFSSLDEFSDSAYAYRTLVKYQGYLYASYVDAIMAIDGKSEDEVERLLLLEAV